MMRVIDRTSHVWKRLYQWISVCSIESQVQKRAFRLSAKALDLDGAQHYLDLMQSMERS